MAVLEVKNLKKGFGATVVLKGVSFSLERGQVLAIIGSSGSGKTTLLRCLNFLETPDVGQILADGNAVSVKNGTLDLSGTVTATGYTVGEFVYLSDGTLLVPGGTLTVSTGEAVYTLTLTDVDATTENRAN